MRRQLEAREFLQFLVGIPQLLTAQILLLSELRARNFLFVIGEVFKLVQEPLVDFRYRINFINRYSALDCLVNYKQPFVGQVGKSLNNFFVRKLCEFGDIEGSNRNFRAAHGFHYRHFEARADCHDLTRGFHSRAQLSLCVQEFIERPFGELYDHIVERRLETSIGFARNVVFNLVESVSQRDFSRDLGYGITRRLRGKRGRARNPRIDLYYRILERIGVERKLTVTAALYFKLGNDIERRRPQHLIFLVRKRDGRRNYNRIARMNSDGVEVFHRAHGEHVALAVAQNLEFDFLPAAYILFDKHLSYGRKHKPVIGY